MPARRNGFGGRPWARATRGAGLVLLVGCAASPRSEWPPTDFYLEVRSRLQPPTGMQRDLQSLHVFADGLVVYRETADEDQLDSMWPPVFSRVSAYRLSPPSLRSLSRDLYLAGVQQMGTQVGGDSLAPEVVAIRWRMFGQHESRVGRGRLYGVFTEVLHAINAYLPPGAAFTLPDMTGEPRPSRLSRVPQPQRSVEGAHSVMQTWRDRFAGDLEVGAERVALALAAGDVAGARDEIERLQQEGGGALSDELRGEVLAALRALLPPRR